MKQKFHVNCEYFKDGKCRHPRAPYPVVAMWPRCILVTEDIRIACKEQLPDPMAKQKAIAA